MAFNIDFKPQDYVEIFPDIPPSEEIINYNCDLEDRVWTRQVPEKITANFVDLELKRLKQGAFIGIKDEVLWIPPNYYQFLQYGIAGGSAPEFRLKKLKHKYFKIQVRNNPEAIGTYTIKNRQDGETTDVISDCLWELGDGVNYHGQIGIQSKTDQDSYNPCWTTMKSQWMSYPKWLKNLLYSDFASGNNIETQMRFTRPEADGVKSRNLWAAYYPSVYNAMDGKNNVLRCVLDEVNKWKNCSFYDTFINYKKFILVGKSRRGMFDIFSSPADVNGKWNDEAFAFWQTCDPDKLDKNGTTQSRVFRWFSNPLEGIEGCYDRFGDADANYIYEHIMRERASLKEDKRLAEVRGYPLNEEEMFGSFEKNTMWDNHKGIVARKLYVMSSIYKNEETKEPKYIWGNLEWESGLVDVKTPVFRANEENVFDLAKGRFCFSEIPDNSIELKDIKKPPQLVESCLGIDPFNMRYETKQATRGSSAGCVNLKFRKLSVQDFNMRPTMIYNCRPHQELFFEDMIKAAVYNRSLVQYENRSDKLANYFEDRGYFDWLLPEIGAAQNSKRKGDAPAGGKSGAFLNEGIYLINTITNVPLNPDKPYLLDEIWFEELLEQIISFNPKDTHRFDLVMGYIQALIGAAKISNIKKRAGDKINNQMINYFFS